MYYFQRIRLKHSQQASALLNLPVGCRRNESILFRYFCHVLLDELFIDVRVASAFCVTVLNDGANLNKWEVGVYGAASPAIVVCNGSDIADYCRVKL